ncbi:MAG: autotransporter outer membrane beta-barrel domain-containing protein [Pseudomonadota bacterium]
MTMSRNAVGNLIARYKKVLQNCSLMNVFGSLAAATVLSGALVLGGATGALAVTDYYAVESGTTDSTATLSEAVNRLYLGQEITDVDADFTIEITTSEVVMTSGAVIEYDVYLGNYYNDSDKSQGVSSIGSSHLIVEGGEFDNGAYIYARGNYSSYSSLFWDDTITEAKVTFVGESGTGEEATSGYTNLYDGYSGLKIYNEGKAKSSTTSAGVTTYDYSLMADSFILEFGTTGENGVAYIGDFNATLNCVNYVTVNEGSDVTMTLPTFNWYANHYKDGAGTLHIAGDGFYFWGASFSILEGTLDIENGWKFGAEGTQGVDALVVASGVTLKVGGELNLAETYWDQAISISGVLEAGSVVQIDGNNATFNIENGGSFTTSSFIATGEMALNVNAGGSASIDTFTLTDGYAQTISTGQLVITSADDASFGDASNGVLTVGTLTLVDDATITLYYTEFQASDVDTTQAAIAAVADGSDDFTVQLIGTLVDASGIAADLAATAGTDGTIQATDDSVYSNDGSTFATGNSLSVDASSVTAGSDSTASLTSSTSGLGTVKDVVVDTGDSTATSVDVKLTGGTTTLVGDGTGALLSASNESGTTVSTSLTVTNNSTLNVGVTDNLNAQGGSLESVTVGEGSGDGATFNVNTASATIEFLTANATAQINVLNSSLVAETYKSEAGSILFIDPAYVQIKDVVNASFEGTTLVSAGSVLALGDSDIAYWQELVEAAGYATADLDTGFTVGTAQSAIIISGTALDLGESGSLIVDADVDNTGAITGVGTIADGAAYFGDDSLCIIDMSAWSTTDAALTASTITTAEGAKLLVTTTGATLTEGEDGESTATIKIASGTAASDAVTIATDSWGNGEDGVDTDTIFLDNAFMEVTSVTKEDSSYSITIGQVDASDALGVNLDSGLAALIDNAIASGVDSAGIDFIKDASNQDNGDVIIEGATKLAANAAVVPGLSSVNAAAAANMGARTTIVPQAKATAAADSSNWLAMNGDGAILPTADGGNMAQGFGIWFMPMYNHTSADGFKSGSYNYGYDTDIVGATLGADYTFASDLRLGLAFNVGSGSSKSTGDFATTENDFDYVGVSVYGAKHFDALGLSFDMGYTASENEMVQDATDGDLYGDADASLFTVGVKAEYLIPLDSFNVTPYAGLRFNYYDVDAYDTKQNGDALFSTASGDNTVWEIPVGVTFDTTTKVGSWDMTPSLGLGVKFAMGDLDADQEVSIAGDAGSVVLSSEVADEVTFQGALGLGFAKENCTIGLNYTLDLSENVESHGVSVNLRYEF